MSTHLHRVCLVCALVSLAVSCASAQDSWKGGLGFWSVGSNWSTGAPPLSSQDAIINSGGKDDVTLDVSPTVNSLTFMGTPTIVSFLEDKGTSQTLTISNDLTTYQSHLEMTGSASSLIVGGNVSNGGFIGVINGATMSVSGKVDNLAGGTLSASGSGLTLTISGLLTNDPGTASSSYLLIGGAGNTVNVGSFSNNGYLYEFSATSTLNLTNQPGGVTDALPGSVWELAGSFTEAGTHFGFANLASIEGSIDFDSGQTLAINPGGTLQISNSGGFSVAAGTSLTISGNVNNAGFIGTGASTTGGNNILTITGDLTNQSESLLAIYGPNDVVTVGSLNNLGTTDPFLGTTIDIENGSTLNVLGNAVNTAIITLGQFAGGNSLNVTGTLTNSGSISVKNSSTVDPLHVDNIGIISIDSTSKFIVGTGLPTGLGYTQFADGTLIERITNSNFGQIFAGSASLSGTLDIQLANGFAPGVGTSYDIILLSPGGLTGHFSNVLNDTFNNGTEFWYVNYDYANGLVELIAEQVAPTPEPTSFLLLGSGLLSLAYGFRHRVQK